MKIKENLAICARPAQIPNVFPKADPVSYLLLVFYFWVLRWNIFVADVVTAVIETFTVRQELKEKIPFIYGTL